MVSVSDSFVTHEIRHLTEVQRYFGVSHIVFINILLSFWVIMTSELKIWGILRVLHCVIEHPLSFVTL